MKYRVHSLKADKKTVREELENFLNQQKGEIIAVLPYVHPAFQMMGATSKVGFLLVVKRSNRPGFVMLPDCVFPVGLKVLMDWIPDYWSPPMMDPR